MALLAVAVANGETALGLVLDGEVLARWRVSTDQRRTADEWAVLLRGLLGPRLAEVDGIAVCATVPGVLREWREMLGRHFADVRRLVVEPGTRTGVPVRVESPREVGTDRVLNALAAARLYGGPAIVVDLGATATTFDVLDASGAYVGGAIAPGAELSREALGRGGAQLREVELARPRTVIARNTVEALQSGLVLGLAGQVEGLVERMLAELGSSSAGHPGDPGDAGDPGDPGRAAVIATGPLAPLVLEECGCFTAHVPLLTLLGLSFAFERNT